MTAFDRAAARFAAEQHQRIPLPHQIPPPGDWFGHVLLGGRGCGKTWTAAKYVVDHVNGPACIPGPIPHWIGILAPTQGDAATACYSGPSGIRSHDPTAKLTQSVGGAAVRWPNGSEAKLFGGSTPDEVERLRAGGSRCLFWIEELAAIRHLDDCFDHMRFGLREGDRPHFIASTTPKPRPLIKALVNGDIPNVVITRGTTHDNPHLPEHIRDALEDRYGGTALGAQELMGQLIEADENALWSRAMIERNRIKNASPEQVRDRCTRTTVGVDPSGGAGEQGIVVVGREDRRVDGRVEAHGYVLADRSCRLSPDGWGRAVVQAYLDFDADDVVVEVNYGGDMAVSVIRGAADGMGVALSIRTVTSSRGKRVRAEPVAALAERDRWHHVGVFEALEDQQCVWTPESGYSPDRLDAAVFGATHLKLAGTATTNAVGSWGGSVLSRTRLY